MFRVVNRESKIWLDERGLQADWLPHFFRRKLYRWAYDFICTQNRKAFICGANQISKSSTAIRKNIYLATCPEVWDTTFPFLSGKPNLFWYFYPSKATIQIEFETKWSEWLPRVPKHHPMHAIYGHTVQKDATGTPFTLTFNSGVTINFRSYTQSEMGHQSSTVAMVTCDEELPVHLCPELFARLTASGGIFNHVFTATLGQTIWYETMEKMGDPLEKYPDAFKRCVSLYDCTQYLDGDSRTPWNLGRINQQKEVYANDDEVKRRVYGRFVSSRSGLAYFGFNKKSCYTRRTDQIQDGCRVYSLIDVGSGGVQNSAAAIINFCVNKASTQAYILNCWRGDGILTTSPDIMEQWQIMTKGLQVFEVIPDPSSREFSLTFERAHPEVPLRRFKKSVHQGYSKANDYLQAGAIRLPLTRPAGVSWYDQDHVSRLADELNTVKLAKTPTSGKRRGQVDDLTDCLRYFSFCVVLDISAKSPKEEETPLIRVGRGLYFPWELEPDRDDAWTPDEEVRYWNQLHSS